MLIKTVYTKNEFKEEITNVYECDRYILKRGREGNFLDIESTERGIVSIEIPSIDAYKETFVIYIMNSNGKTTDSYFFGNFPKRAKEKTRVRESE